MIPGLFDSGPANMVKRYLFLHLNKRFIHP